MRSPRRGVPAEVVIAARDMVHNPQLRHRGLFEAEDHPLTGRTEMPTLPFRFASIDRLDAPPVADPRSAQRRGARRGGRRRGARRAAGGRGDRRPGHRSVSPASMDRSPKRSRLPMNADDLILISVDDHICEPPDMFDAHVPAKYRDVAPKVVVQDGRQQWVYFDRPGRDLGLNAVAGKPREMFNVDALRYDEMRPGCYDVHERVRDMDAGGQLAGLNFPNFTGFSGQVLNQGPDPVVNVVMIRAYNDWHVDEWCGAHPDRFIPCGILPLWDVDKAAAEVRRLADKGCHAVTFSENPEALQMPSIHSGSGTRCSRRRATSARSCAATWARPRDRRPRRATRRPASR